jgi:tetratricopeptide (TPR) repeat protein
MRNRFLILALPALAALALAALLFAAGCERGDSPPATIEADEPAYRRGKELLRQGRNQEALAEFTKVLEKRGLSHAAESHLELGLLYQQHINDPIAAIYHFRKYRELKPNSPQADLVRQRMEAAMREYARTLPGRPLGASPLAPADYADALQRLQRENEQLQAALTSARATAGRPAPGAAAGAVIVRATPAPPDEIYPVATFDPTPNPNPNAGRLSTPVRPSGTSSYAQFQQQQQQQQSVRPAPPQADARIHTVRAGDSLYKIARQYYGTASNARVDAIFTANRDVLRSTTDLRVGMQLRIP